MKSLLVILSLLSALFLPMLGHALAYPYERMELARVLERQPQSLRMTRYVPLQDKDRLFVDHYWKVYYQKNRIVGEELFEKGRLSYYYVYFYDQKKIYQKGFFWYGIRRKIFAIAIHGKQLKQGFLYKNIPDVYQTYDRQSLKQLYSYHYAKNQL